MRQEWNITLDEENGRYGETDTRLASSATWAGKKAIRTLGDVMIRHRQWWQRFDFSKTRDALDRRGSGVKPNAYLTTECKTDIEQSTDSDALRERCHRRYAEAHGVRYETLGGVAKSDINDAVSKFSYNIRHPKKTSSDK